MLNTTFNSEIKSTKYDSYKRLPAARVPMTAELVQLLPHVASHRVAFTDKFLVVSSITAQITVVT